MSAHRGSPAVSGDGAAATVAVAALVSDSSWPASSVKVTLTLMALPSSVEVRVYVESVAFVISVSPATHW